MIQIEDQDLAKLDRIARKQGKSRAALVRRLIQHEIAQSRRDNELAQVVQAYKQQPPEDLHQPKSTLRKVWPE